MTYDTVFEYTKSLRVIHIRDVHFLERLPSRQYIDDFDGASLSRQGYASWFDSLTSLVTGALWVGGVEAYLMTTTNVLQFGLAACPELESLCRRRYR